MKLQEFCDKVFDECARYVERAFEPVAAKFAELEAMIKAIPAGKDGRDGAPGERGEAGPRGERGEKGETGSAGERGAPGDSGPRGERGEKGEKGDPGEHGKDGAPGVDGKDGAPGAKGEKGDPGHDGKDGAAGKDGAPGADGRSAYQVAVDKGYRGTELEWLESLKGQRGESGKDGRDGREGKDGRDGVDGKDGAPGRDALELDILPTIDEARSYARGTFARHAGGLWRATANTQGMRGWECIVVGVAGIDVALADERRFSVTLRLSDGDPVVHEFALPFLFERGVYVPERKYMKGDGVTYAGSYWIALIDEPSKKPGDPTDGKDGTPQQWRLAVKRGRDGKDSK